MTTGMPELGSKISLISKADIRYEGRLFTVDPQECTIALASVRSFGTEDRETQYPVPAQNQVYDYILFRGSDIKDIRVVHNVTHPQPLNDPAIMQLSVPPSLGTQPFQSHPMLGSMGPQFGQFVGAYSGLGVMGGLNPGLGTSITTMQRESRNLSSSKSSELNITRPEPTSSVLSPTVEPTRPSNNHDLIGGSRSTTPASLISRKSPTSDQGVQAGGSRRDDKVVKPIQPPNQRSQQKKHSHDRGELKNEGQQAQPKFGNTRNQPSNSQQGYSNRQDQHNPGHGYHGYHQSRQNNQNNQRPNWLKGLVRPRGRPRGTFRSNQGQSSQGNKIRSTLKFENDYDFEQANTEFEELRNQLAKVRVDEVGSTSRRSEISGDIDKKDDSGNETGAGEPEQEEEHEVFYDKSKSFFDKISCEAVERAKGKSQRTDWRIERKLNTETFGVNATKRGNYRGRGGSRGMGYQGGYRNNYRQPQHRGQQHHAQYDSQLDQNQRQRNAKTSINNIKQVSSSAQSDTNATTKIESHSSPINQNSKHLIPEPEISCS